MKGHSQYLDDLKKENPGFERFIDKLPTKPRFVIEERLKGRILREIGADLGLSQERVRQIESRACRLLRKYTWNS